MKNTLSFFFLAIAFAIAIAAPVNAAAQHTAVSNWKDSPDKAAHPTLSYRVERAPGPCPATGSPAGQAQIAAGIATTTYSDSTVDIGSYCYTVRAFFNGSESVDSNTAQANVLPLPPTGLQIASVATLQLGKKVIVAGVITAPPNEALTWTATSVQNKQVGAGSLSGASGIYSMLWAGKQSYFPVQLKVCDSSGCGSVTVNR